VVAGGPSIAVYVGSKSYSFSAACDCPAATVTLYFVWLCLAPLSGAPALSINVRNNQVAPYPKTCPDDNGVVIDVGDYSSEGAALSQLSPPNCYPLAMTGQAKIDGGPDAMASIFGLCDGGQATDNLTVTQ